MKKFTSLFTAFLLVFSFLALPGYADTASYTTLTAAQEDQMNSIGGPTAIASSRRVNLGTLLKELLDPSFTLSPSADSATTNKELVLALTSPADTTGTNSHYAQDITLTIGNATGGTNAVRGINIANVTGDAQVNVRGISIGTGTILGTSLGMFIGGGWDSALEMDVAASADSANTNLGLDVDLTSPVDTTGTNSHYGINVDTTVGNATGGTNSVIGFNFANVTGDAQVDVTAINVGTGTILGTSRAIVVGTGWDKALDLSSAPGADSGATNDLVDVNLTTPVDTTGTNTHSAVNVDLTIGNASGGTNVANGINISAITGDAQVTENGIKIGSGFDAGITTASPIVGTGNDMGWAVVAGANAACTSTCTSACIFGVNTAATEADIVNCADTTADECLCAGGS